MKSFKRKNEAWELVTGAFNADDRVTKGTPKQLQTLWRDMKMKAKKDRARFSRESYRATGGGPAPAPVENLTDQVEAILPTEFAGVPGVLDDDYEMAGEFYTYPSVRNQTLIIYLKCVML